MTYIITFLTLYLWLATLSALAGDSFPIKSINQYLNKILGKTIGGKFPEILLALTISIISTGGLYTALEEFSWWLVPFFVVMSVIAYAGKESATKGYLEWTGSTEDTNGDGVVNNDDARNNTLTGWNQWVSGLFGWQNGDEGYSWVWAVTKGFITTLPLGGTGAIFMPLGREAASHAKGRLKGDPNFYLEFFGDGFGYAASATLFLYIVGLV